MSNAIYAAVDTGGGCLQQLCASVHEVAENRLDALRKRHRRALRLVELVLPTFLIVCTRPRGMTAEPYGFRTSSNSLPALSIHVTRIVPCVRTRHCV